MKVVAPKHFTHNYIEEFLRESEKVFKSKNRQITGFLFDFSKVKNTSMLAVLLVYKLIEFSFKHNCFYQPAAIMSSDLIRAFQKYGFTDLISNFMEKGKNFEKLYKNLEIKVEDNFIIAPQALLRDSNYSSDALKKKFLPVIQNYYSINSKTVSMIFICLSEILLNFWEHAVADTNSIIVANGNKQNIEIACADTGLGIVGTLGPLIELKEFRADAIVSKAVKKGVTSKVNTHHMGYGLWILTEIVKATKGRMHLYSQGGYYISEFGKERSGKCSYWDGTIVYLSLPLNNPVQLSDLQVYQKENFDNLKINFG